MPTTKPFQPQFPVAPGDAVRIILGTFWHLVSGLPWWCYVVIAVAVTARLIVGKPLGR